MVRYKSYDSLESSGDKNTFIVEDPKHLVGGTPHEDPSGMPLSAYLCLAVAVIGLSLIGPLLNMQDEVDPMLKIIWQNAATSIALAPLAMYSVLTQGFPSLTRLQVIVLLLVGASYAGVMVFFSWSLQYTSVGNAVLIGNCQAILFLIERAVVGETISLPEGLGAIVAFLGAFLCSRHSAEGDTEAPGNSSLLGDGYGIICAISGVVYLVTAKRVRPAMNLYTFMFCVMFLAALDAFILAHIAGIEVSWDRDPNHGVFGWINIESNRLPLEIVMIISCQFFGAMGKWCLDWYSYRLAMMSKLSHSSRFGILSNQATFDVCTTFPTSSFWWPRS